MVYYQTFSGNIMYLWYNSQKKFPFYKATLEEFREKISKNKDYLRNYQDWSISGFHHSLMPTVVVKNDRLVVVPTYLKSIKKNEKIRKYHYLQTERQKLVDKLIDRGYDRTQIAIIFNLDRSTIAKIAKRSKPIKNNK